MKSANNPDYGFKNISCIPLNKEKYVSFSIDTYRFLDSFQFMPSSAATLMKNLKDSKGVDGFKNMKKYFEGEQLDMISQKGVCPYEYLNSIEKFNDTTLPSKSEFYSKLNDSHITDKEYNFAINLWNKFECKTMKDYLELYLKADVLGMADVFEEFRNVCYENYGLDPLHYYTAPGLSWDALFKYTKEKLELFTDIEKYMLCEDGKRGVWRRSLEMAYQRRTVFRCKRNKGIYYWKFRCNQEGGGRNGNDTRVASTVRCNRGELS